MTKAVKRAERAGKGCMGLRFDLQLPTHEAEPHQHGNRENVIEQKEARLTCHLHSDNVPLTAQLTALLLGAHFLTATHLDAELDLSASCQIERAPNALLCFA
eukprot:1785514-Prymnesium_polylepis.1